MSASRRLCAPLLALLSLAACSDPQTAAAEGELVLEPASLALPRTFLGYPVQRTFGIRNAGRAPLHVDLTCQAPLSVEPSRVDLESAGSVVVTVTFAPTAPGDFNGIVQVRSEVGDGVVAIAGRAELPLECPAAAACHSVAFDAVAGTCADTVLADGTGCTLVNACLSEARCSAGECVGRPVDCDDRNACTRDSCEPGSGCAHADLSGECPAPSEPCKVATCDAAAGCGVADAADGAPCGAADCSTADVCLLGRCVTVPVPEGTPCFPETPCQGPGVCHLQQCQRPAPEPMVPAWSYRSPDEGLRLQFAGTMDEQGQSYLLEVAKDRGVFTSLTREGFVRYRRDLAPVAWSWYAASVTLDLATRTAYLTNSRTIVEARRMADGELLWQADLDQLLTAEDTGWYVRQFGVNGITPHPAQGLVVLSIVVGEESHRSLLVGLDAKTGAVRWKVGRDGHFYGYVADAEGNTFVSAYGCWASSGELLSVDPDGQLRWSTQAGGHPFGLSREAGLLVYRSPLLTSVDPATGADQRVVSPSVSYYGEIVAGSKDVWFWDNQWTGSSPSRLLKAADPATGAERWAAHVADEGVRGTAMLTSRDTLLTVTAPGYGPGGEPPIHTLREYGPGATEVFACELPGFLTGTAALVNGRWSAVVGGALQSFPAPGLDLATEGWVAAQGSLARTGQPR
ncbi:MAG: PQQ-binding-like beta-propeller repeat protein [Myxococcales bacterium]